MLILADAHIFGYFMVSPRSKEPEYLELYARKRLFIF